ncbi:unnamed protein product [Mytilus coruscus]|uniref:Endonuclease/exonuclease/phosphatase domain-containing protein n=1 Tax=Mytilus coruscus TaxID=42192 RepID=A0A6J7ZZN1_MYTCO|nr:unnamed protein product [Mytilus coruscus]
MIVTYGIIDHASNYAQMTMNYSKDLMFKLCCKCDSINVSSLTFHNYKLNTTNYYEPLSHKITFESISSSIFSPLKASSPKMRTNLKKQSEHNKGTLGGGVFILVHNDIITVEQTELVTNCEIEWVKIQFKGKKELLIGSFYMPQRNMKCVEELEKSLNVAIARNTNIMLTGDINCLDINWETSTVNSNANDKEIKNKIMELTATFNLLKYMNYHQEKSTSLI